MRCTPVASCRSAAAGLGVLILALCLTGIAAQPPASVQVSGADQGKPDLDALIAQFIATTEEYERTFRNPVAEETKVIELYRASGEVEKRREIVSDLVVYRSSRAESGAATEFRDVRSVDGKSIEKRCDRALKLLAEASGAESIEQELRTIDRETARHEIKGHLRGFTVRQFAVRPNWRETHHVEWAGREQIAGRDVVMLNYRLRRPDMRSRFPLPREIRNPTYIQRGRIWLDAETGQLRRAVWEIAVAHPDAAEPLALVHCDSFIRQAPSASSSRSASSSTGCCATSTRRTARRRSR